MAVQSPPPTHSPTPPAPAGTRRGGCGCGGCLLVLLLIVALVAAGIYFFAIVPASAGAPAPAQLSAYVEKVEVGTNNSGFAAAPTGRLIKPGNTVRTDSGGRASLLFPDGSVTRLAGSTTVTLTQETVDNQGHLHNLVLDQEAGRTYQTVQPLAGDAHFSLRGHGITADVRGTEFEVWLKPDRSALVKLFKGRLQLTSQRGSLDLISGRQLAIAADGGLGAATPIAADPADPFAAWLGAENAAAAGNRPGSLQIAHSAGPLAATGTPVESARYQFPGGDLTVALAYPGSAMKLEVVGASGAVVATAQGAQPIVIHIPNAAPGAYKARITGLVLDHGPEPWTVAFASNPPCTPVAPPSGGVAPGAQVRVTGSGFDLAQAVATAGLANGSLHIEPSPAGATVTGTVSANGLTWAGTADVYAAPPGLGVTVASGSLQGISVTSALAARLAELSGRSLESLNVGFVVDRVYSCKGAQGGMLVVEGHGQS